jgi:hypothetical protein
MKIFKYGPLIPGEQSIIVPISSNLLHFHEQEGSLQVWAAVPAEGTPRPRNLFVAATGQEVDNTRWVYIATAHLGWTVWHLFEERT